MDFRKLKVTGKFSSDNDTLQFLLRKHKALEEQSLECDLSCSNSHVASVLLPIAPVCCSTPTGMVSNNFMHEHLQKIFNDSIMYVTCLLCSTPTHTCVGAGTQEQE